MRESEHGYTIDEPVTLTPRLRRDKLRLALVALGSLGAGVAAWQVLRGAVPGAGMAVRLVSSVLAINLFAMLGLLAWLRGWHRVEVDLDNRRFRFSRLVLMFGHTQLSALLDVPFGAAGELVLVRRRTPGREAGRTSLCLRRPGMAERDWPCIATGKEAELRALHRRIAGDLEPLESRLAVAAGAARNGVRRAALAFQPLGPDEMTAA